VRSLPLRVECDGVELAGEVVVPARVEGAVVLLHGLPSTTPPEPGDEGYAGFARRFAERGWLAAWADMRAVRGSPGYFSITGWVRDALAITYALRALPEIDGLPLALIGSSAGGAVSAEAVRRGAPADALVLLAAPAEWVSFAADAAAGARRITEESGMALAPEVIEDPRAWAAEFLDVVTKQAVAAARVPLLVVHGSDDDVVPVAHARRIAAHAERADLRIIEGAGHGLRRDEDAVAIVLEWLESVLW
jgi:uncharacterized protein